jgi:hypothetical protein
LPVHDVARSPSVLIGATLLECGNPDARQFMLVKRRL